jgi:hypothetical protein
MKKCPRGVICIENITFAFFLLCIVFLVFLLIYSYINVIAKKPLRKTTNNNTYLSFQPEVLTPTDTLLNPYSPPLRDERYFPSSPLGCVPRGGIPINQQTNIGAIDTTYRQMGIMTPLNSKSKDNILPLMGRPLFVNRDKWNYYTISNQHNNVKLPVSRAGKSCTNEYGCDRLYAGDTVYIDGANEVYRVTIYDNDTIRYLPFI